MSIQLPKLPSNNIFTDQEGVDKYVLETEEYAEQCQDEETAIKLYKRISRLQTASQLYFVPDIVFSWEEMALSYIESPAAVFECVHYEQIQKMHERGFQAFKSLEQHVINNVLPADALFGMIHGFNVDIKEFNKFCKKYHQEPFDYYKCSDSKLQQKYDLWIGGS